MLTEVLNLHSHKGMVISPYSGTSAILASVSGEEGVLGSRGEMRRKGNDRGREVEGEKEREKERHI